MSRSQRIYDALFAELKPETLLIENESHRHNVPEGAETHFKVVVVSSLFQDMPPIARHRLVLVNKIVANEFASGLHALSLHLYTSSEWKKTAVPNSPACHNRKKS